MRPPGRSLSTVRSLLLLTACLALIGLLAASQAPAQDIRLAQTDLPRGQAVTKTPIPPVKKVETKLVIQESKFGMLFISGKLYQIGINAKLYNIGGKLVSATDLKPNEVVAVEYLTGGTRSEGYPYSPSQRVITTLRVLAKGKK
jgi:hypothetical protein